MTRLAKLVTADGISTVVPMSGDLPHTIQRAIDYFPPRRLVDWANPTAAALSGSVPIRTYEYYGSEHDPERGELFIYRERYEASR